MSSDSDNDFSDDVYIVMAGLDIMLEEQTAKTGGAVSTYKRNFFNKDTGSTLDLKFRKVFGTEIVGVDFVKGGNVSNDSSDVNDINDILSDDESITGSEEINVFEYTSDNSSSDSSSSSSSSDDYFESDSSLSDDSDIENIDDLLDD